MDLVQRPNSPRALVCEAEGLVAERVRRMLAEQNIASVLVAQAELFEELRARLAFDLFVVGVRSASQLEEFPGADLQPLVLLAPLGRGQGVAHFRMALPRALLVDRALRDPDALRGVLQSGTPRESAPRGELLRQAFEPFDLSGRQLEVLSRALLGESSAEIARRLYISQLTVRNHLHAIYERVGVSGRRELQGRFVRGLVEEGHA